MLKRPQKTKPTLHVCPSIFTSNQLCDQAVKPLCCGNVSAMHTFCINERLNDLSKRYISSTAMQNRERSLLKLIENIQGERKNSR